MIAGSFEQHAHAQQLPALPGIEGTLWKIVQTTGRWIPAWEVSPNGIWQQIPQSEQPFKS